MRQLLLTAAVLALQLALQLCGQAPLVNGTVVTLALSPAPPVFGVLAPPVLPPTLTSVAPTAGVQGVGTAVTFTGTGLAGAVAINAGVGVAGTIVSATATTISAVLAVSTNAATGARAVTVTTPGGTSNSVTFSITAAMLGPTLTSVSPSSGVQGTTATYTLSGTNLTGATQVYFNNVANYFTATNLTVVNATTVTLTIQINLAAPVGAGVTGIVIVTPNGTSTALPFTVTAANVTTITAEPTNTQAILRMPTAPATCAVEVSTSATYAPLVPDVDPALFSGAGTYTQNAGKWFVVGKRQLGTTLGNKLVSRALQAETLHYYRVTCPATAVITGTFTTQTLQASTYLETASAVTPLADPTNRDEQLIDPLTGVAYKKLTLPGDRVQSVNNVSLQKTFPLTLTTAKTFLPADNTAVYVGPIAFLKSDPAANQYSFHYFQVIATYPTTGATISACLTFDGATCAANGNTYNSTPGTSSATFGTKTVGDLWQLAGYPLYPPTAVARQGGLALFGTLMWVNSGTVSLTSATYSYQLGTKQIIPFGGAVDMCAASTTLGPEGRPGYNCYLNQNGTIYWVDAVNGKVHLMARFLNNTVSSANGCGLADGIIFDSVNPDKWYCGGNQNAPGNQQLWSFTYHGNHGEPPASYDESTALPVCDGGITNQPCTVPVNLTAGTDLGTLTQAFDANFQKDRFLYFYFVGIEDGKLIYRVWRSNQHSIGWTVVYDPTVPGVVAAISSWRSPGQRWCGQKSNEPIYTPGWLSVGPFTLNTESGAGHGPYVVNATGAESAATCPGGFSGTCITIPVDGEPYNLAPCTADATTCSGAVESSAKGELQNAAVNDEFTLDGVGGSTRERLVLAAKTDATHWIFQRAINGVTTTLTGTNQLWTACNTNPAPLNLDAGSGAYWNYAVDPHGTSQLSRDPYSKNAHFFAQNQTMASSYSGSDARCTGGVFGRSCYQVRTWTSIANFISTVPQGILTLSPTFGGKYGIADGNQVQTHPSGAGLAATTAQKAFFFDARPFNGASFSDSAVNTSGNLWKFTASGIHGLDRKYLPTFAYAGAHQLTDVSSAAINGSMPTAYTYCVANNSAECVFGSQPGDVYVNAPGVTRNYCYTAGQATGLPPTEVDLCIGNNSMVYNSVMQLPVGVVENVGAGFRALTHGFVVPRNQFVFDNTHPIPSGNWLIYDTQGLNGGAYDQIALINVPSQPAADAVNRTAFISTPITVPAVGGADNAIVEFGYAEYGGYCTSRAEACATGVAAAAPFYFETTEAASLTGVSCASGCTVNVPAVSQHILQGHIIYRIGTGFVSNGPQFSVAIP